MFQKNWVIIFALFLSVFIFLGVTGTLTSGYHFIDDHEIISISNNLKSESLIKVISNYINYDLPSRFRPMYYFHRVIETKIFGTNLFLWSLYTGVLAFITFSSFYLGLKNLMFSTFEAIVFLIIAFVGPQMAVWWRLGPAETIGVVFLGFCFYFMTKCITTKYYTLSSLLFCLFLVLSSLCKESFIIIIPAFITYKIWNEKSTFISLKKTLIKNFILIVPIVLMFLELLIIKSYIGTNKIGYAGLDSNLIETMKGITHVINSLFEYFSPFLLFVIITMGLIYYKLRDRDKFIRVSISLMLPLVFCFLIVFPNTILYAKSGMFERYLLPSTIGVSFFIVSLIRSIDNRFKWLKRLLLVVIIIVSLNPIRYSLREAYSFSDIGHDTNLLLSSIIKYSNGEDKGILLAVDPVVSYECTLSLNEYLGYKNITNLYGLALNDKYADDFSQRLSSDWHLWFKGKEMKDMNDKPYMIVFLDKNLSNDYFKNPKNGSADYQNVIPYSSTFALYIQK